MEDLLNLNINLSDKKQTLLLMVAAQALLCVPFSFCAFIVASTANAGFNVVLTALINSAFSAGAYHVLQNSVSQVAVGFLIGCSMMVTMVSLMTAVYWGQLSKCEVTKFSISQYSCDNKTAYGAVSAFATLLFLIQVIFTGSLVGWKAELVSDVSRSEEDLTAPSMGGISSNQVKQASGSSGVYRNLNSHVIGRIPPTSDSDEL